MWAGATRNTTSQRFPLFVESVTPTVTIGATATVTTTVVAFRCTVLLPSGGYMLVLPNYYGINRLVALPVSLLGPISCTHSLTHTHAFLSHGMIDGYLLVVWAAHQGLACARGRGSVRQH